MLWIIILTMWQTFGQWPRNDVPIALVAGEEMLDWGYLTPPDNIQMRERDVAEEREQTP